MTETLMLFLSKSKKFIVIINYDNYLIKKLEIMVYKYHEKCL